MPPISLTAQPHPLPVTRARIPIRTPCATRTASLRSDLPEAGDPCRHPLIPPLAPSTRRCTPGVTYPFYGSRAPSIDRLVRPNKRYRNIFLHVFLLHSAAVFIKKKRHFPDRDFTTSIALHNDRRRRSFTSAQKLDRQ